MKKNTTSQKRKLSELKKLNPACAGIDVGASELFVCIAKNETSQKVRTFSTFTADLREMVQWLQCNGVKSG